MKALEKMLKEWKIRTDGKLVIITRYPCRPVTGLIGGVLFVDGDMILRERDYASVDAIRDYILGDHRGVVLSFQEHRLAEVRKSPMFDQVIPIVDFIIKWPKQ